MQTALEAGGAAAFFPTRRVRRAWSDRTKTITEPLFPGYVFCRMSRGERRRRLQVAGVIDAVGFGGRPEPIDDEEIESLRTLTRSGVDLAEVTRLTPGERVRVVDGPLAGASGILEKIRNRRRLIVRVSILQRAVGAEVDAGCVERVALAGAGR